MQEEREFQEQFSNYICVQYIMFLVSIKLAISFFTVWRVARISTCIYFAAHRRNGSRTDLFPFVCSTLCFFVTVKKPRIWSVVPVVVSTMRDDAGSQIFSSTLLNMVHEATAFCRSKLQRRNALCTGNDAEMIAPFATRNRFPRYVATISFYAQICPAHEDTETNACISAFFFRRL